MENPSHELAITIRVSSRIDQHPNKKYTLTLDTYNDFFREFPREEIRSHFYDMLKLPSDTFLIEVTNDNCDVLFTSIYDTNVELSDFFDMVETTVRDYHIRNNFDFTKVKEDTQ